MLQFQSQQVALLMEALKAVGKQCHRLCVLSHEGVHTWNPEYHCLQKITALLTNASGSKLRICTECRENRLSGRVSCGQSIAHMKVVPWTIGIWQRQNSTVG